MTVQIVIPARLQSVRLPRKPLQTIAGKPMIVRTFERCTQVFEPRDIVVATDSPEIGSVCEAHGIDVAYTSGEHRTGTDRVAEVAGAGNAATYINVQGDEPLFEPEDLRIIARAAADTPDVILNGYCPIRDIDEHRSRSVPKVVFAPDGRLLYMSRAPIPGGKDPEAFQFGYRQVCAYAFPARALAALRDHPEKTPLEAAEDIEILRFVEMGFEVRMLAMSDRSIPVDHPDDVLRVEAALRERGED